MDLTLLPGIGPAYRARLQEAGVQDVGDLARAADLDALAQRTGIPRVRLDEAQANAAQLLAKPPQAAAKEVAAAVREAAEDMRVVLRDRMATARVKIGSIWHEDVPIVTARLHENEARIASALRENAVILKEQATTALVRVNGEVRDGFPIFKERVRDAGGVADLVRVRVQEIRERSASDGEGFLGRLFGKKR